MSTQPEFGAPPWAAPVLYALYLGGLQLASNPPPGATGGCTGRAVVPAKLVGSSVYTVGRGADGAVLTVAVDSIALGPQVCMAPAARAALALIETGTMPIGGSPTDGRRQGRHGRDHHAARRPPARPRRKALPGQPRS